jgi:vacuole morphology and inheritance protein 14
MFLRSQAYELAAALAFQLADVEVTVGFFLQLDKLVQLLESPIFIPLRLQLLEPHRYPFLLKALYGVLMLLPQVCAWLE